MLTSSARSPLKKRREKRKNHLTFASSIDADGDGGRAPRGESTSSSLKRLLLLRKGRRVLSKSLRKVDNLFVEEAFSLWALLMPLRGAGLLASISIGQLEIPQEMMHARDAYWPSSSGLPWQGFYVFPTDPVCSICISRRGVSGFFHTKKAA